MSEVLEYLRKKNVEVRKAPGNEVRTTCFFHGEEAGKRGRLYINIDPNAEVAGLFYCHVCGERGGLKKIMKHFGDTPPSDKPQYSSSRHEVLEAAATYYHERMLDKPDIYEWLRKERKLSQEVIVAHQLGWADGGLLDHLKGLGYKIGEIAETGLITEYNGQWSGDGNGFIHAESGNHIPLHEVSATPLGLPFRVVPLRGRNEDHILPIYLRVPHGFGRPDTGGRLVGSGGRGSQP